MDSSIVVLVSASKIILMFVVLSLLISHCHNFNVTCEAPPFALVVWIIKTRITKTFFPCWWWSTVSLVTGNRVSSGTGANNHKLKARKLENFRPDIINVLLLRMETLFLFRMAWLYPWLYINTRSRRTLKVWRVGEIKDCTHHDE